MVDPALFRVHTASARRVERRGFVIDRPTGSGDYLFLYFNQPVKVLDASGLRSHPANICVLYEPDSRQFYHGDEILDNAYVHFNGERVAEWLEFCGVPVNSVLAVALADVTPLLREIVSEQLRQEDRWEEAVSLLVSQFFLKLGRVACRQSRETTYEVDLQERVRSVRERVHSELNARWTVPQMAQLANMSTSRFAALYPEYFNATPIDDLINSRLNHATYLLRQTSMTVDCIAEQCGFSSPQHFSKTFRKNRGLSPGRCR